MDSPQDERTDKTATLVRTTKPKSTYVRVERCPAGNCYWEIPVHGKPRHYTGTPEK